MLMLSLPQTVFLSTLMFLSHISCCKVGYQYYFLSCAAECRLWCDMSCKFLRGKLIWFSIVAIFFLPIELVFAFKVTDPVLSSSGIGACEVVASHIILRKQICTIIDLNIILNFFGRELNLNIYSNEKSSISDLSRGCCHILPDLT